MTDALNKLLESEVLSSEVRVSIKEAWEQKLQEQREAVLSEIREEFANKYEQDKAKIVEAMDLMITEGINTEAALLIEARKAAIEEKKSCKKKLREGIEKFNTFIKDVVTKEVSELHEDRKLMAQKFKTFDKFVAETVKAQVALMNEDRRKLAEDRVNFKRKSKVELAEAKKKMIEETALIAESFIVESVEKEMSQFKDDLEYARKSNFGMKIFEAFAAEFSSTHFNEKKEVNQMTKAIKERDVMVEGLKKQLAEKDTKINESVKELKVLSENVQREKTLNKLLSPLGGEKRELMEELLIKVPTSKLTESFDRYLPAVMEDKIERKVKPLVEARLNTKEVTGNRDNVMTLEENKKESALINEFVGKLTKMDTFSSIR